MERLPNRWLNQLPTGPNKVYASLCCIKYLLNTVSPDNQLGTDLSGLFGRFPNIDKQALGFVAGWEVEPLWQ